MLLWPATDEEDHKGELKLGVRKQVEGSLTNVIDRTSAFCGKLLTL